MGAVANHAGPGGRAPAAGLELRRLLDRGAVGATPGRLWRGRRGRRAARRVAADEHRLRGRGGHARVRRSRLPGAWRPGFAADRPAGPDRGYDQSLLDDVRGRIPVQGWPPEFSESREQLNGAGPVQPGPVQPGEPELPLDLGPAAAEPPPDAEQPGRPDDLKPLSELGLSDEFRSAEDFAAPDEPRPFGVDAPDGGTRRMACPTPGAPPTGFLTRGSRTTPRARTARRVGMPRRAGTAHRADPVPKTGTGAPGTCGPGTCEARTCGPGTRRARTRRTGVRAGDAPAGDVRRRDAPAGEARDGDAPAGEVRDGDAPAGEVRDGDAPGARPGPARRGDGPVPGPRHGSTPRGRTGPLGSGDSPRRRVTRHPRRATPGTAPGDSPASAPGDSSPSGPGQEPPAATHPDDQAPAGPAAASRPSG